MTRRWVRAGAAACVLLVSMLSQVPGSPVRIQGLGRHLGTLEGTVRLAGDGAARPTAVGNTTDPEVCGRTQTLEDLLVEPRSRGVANAIATLVDVPDSVVLPPPTPRRLVIDNRDCRYVPHVSVAALGDTLVALNSDPVFHTTHYYGPVESNVALTRPGQTVPTVAGQVGVITILCDLHGWMKGFVRVDAHRLHDVSDERGRFRIDGLPPGGYTVEVWHERLGTRRVGVEIEAGRASRVEIALVLPEPGGR